MDACQTTPRLPWNKGKLIGQKPPVSPRRRLNRENNIERLSPYDSRRFRGAVPLPVRMISLAELTESLNGVGMKERLVETLCFNAQALVDGSAETSHCGFFVCANRLLRQAGDKFGEFYRSL